MEKVKGNGKTDRDYHLSNRLYPTMDIELHAELTGSAAKPIVACQGIQRLSNRSIPIDCSVAT